MIHLFPTRAFVYVRQCVSSGKVSSNWIGRCHLRRSFHSEVGDKSSPLTLATLGLENKLGMVKKDKINRIQNSSATGKLSSSKEKQVKKDKINRIQNSSATGKLSSSKEKQVRRDEINKIRNPSVGGKFLSSEEKQVKSDNLKTMRVKKPVELGETLFAAKTFAELGLPPILLERLEKVGFSVPTDVQATAIPTISKNHDVVIQSYTGSGKTLAYLLPILSEIGPLKKHYEEGQVEGKAGIEAVVVAPSRELGMQIVREVEKLFGSENKKFVQQLVGGANRSRQEEALKKNKPVIVVGTPGRIAEISAAGKLHTHSCRFLVLDEVDELLSFNYREDLHRILEHVGRRSGAGSVGPHGSLARRVERQTIMVSATVPFSVIRAATSWGTDPLLVRAKEAVTLDSIPNPGPSFPYKPSSNADSVSSVTQGAIASLPPALEHYYCVTKAQHKVDTLRRCIHALDAKSVIAFMNVSKQLKDTVFKLGARGINAAELHGDLGKLARSTTLKKFKLGEVRVLVTNELSARGLDIAECDLVANLDLPTDSIHYAHRAGRTGRLGRKGVVLTICEEPEVFVVRKFRRQLGLSITSCEFAEGKLVLCKEEEENNRVMGAGS